MSTWKIAYVAFALFLTVPANSWAQTPSQAQALEQQGKLPEAEKAWRQITQANPQDAAAFASLGLVLSKQGKYEQAVPAYRNAIALNPKLPGIHLNWGLAQFKQDHFDAAVAALTAAMAAAPRNELSLPLLDLSCNVARQCAEPAYHAQSP